MYSSCKRNPRTSSRSRESLVLFRQPITGARQNSRHAPKCIGILFRRLGLVLRQRLLAMIRMRRLRNLLRPSRMR